jgi:hypothetical protein
MIEPQHKGGGVLRAGHYVVIAAVVVVGALVAFAVLSFLVGVIVEIVKIAVLIAIVAAVVWFLTRSARKRY